MRPRGGAAHSTLRFRPSRQYQRPCVVAAQRGVGFCHQRRCLSARRACRLPSARFAASAGKEEPEASPWESFGCSLVLRDRPHQCVAPFPKCPWMRHGGTRIAHPAQWTNLVPTEALHLAAFSLHPVDSAAAVARSAPDPSGSALCFRQCHAARERGRKPCHHRFRHARVGLGVRPSSGQRRHEEQGRQSHRSAAASTRVAWVSSVVTSYRSARSCD